MARKVRIGIVGTSWWTELMYLPSLASHPDAQIVAICGRRRAPAAALAASWGIPAVYTDHRDLIAHTGLDAVAVVTPDDTHRAITLAAIDRGLHVLCEKPLANNAADALTLWRAAEARGVRHMVLFTWRFLPLYRHLRRLVHEGYVGRLRQLTLHFIGDYALERSYQWRFDGHRANGVLGDLGTHLVDLFRHLAGEVESVSADLSQAVDRAGIDGPAAVPVNDCGFVLLRGVGGVQGLLHVSAASPSGDRSMRMGATLHGDAGTLEAEHVFEGAEMRVDLRGLRPGQARFEAIEIPEAVLDGLRADDLLGAFSRHSAGPRRFIDAIRDDLPIPMTFYDGWRAQQMVDAALRSDRERRWIDLDPDPLSPP